MKRSDIPSTGGLASFVAAAEHGNFTRAANELNLTQGAISRQIREIETHLGIRLFSRIRQRVVLTDAGKLYLSHVKKALDELADGAQRAASLSNSSVLHLVALPTFAARWLIPRLSEFQNGNPTILVQITTRQEPMNFAVEPFDAAVFHGLSHWPGTTSHHLMDLDIVAVCSPRLNANRAIKTPADLAELPLLHKMGTPNLWTEWMAKAGVSPNGPLHGHTYQNFAMVAQAAVAGLGIALLPRCDVENEIAARQLEIVAGEFVATKTSIHLFLPEARAGSSAVRAFTAWLFDEAGKFNSGDHHRPHDKEAARRPQGRHKSLADAAIAAPPRKAG